MKKEILDKKLKFTEKYNWWTSEEKKSKISTTTKIEYIMLRWTADELIFVWKNFDKKLFIKAYNNIKDDWYSLKSVRKSAIKSLIWLYQK